MKTYTYCALMVILVPLTFFAGLGLLHEMIVTSNTQNSLALAVLTFILICLVVAITDIHEKAERRANGLEG